MAEGGSSGIPSWLIVVVVLVGAYFLVKEIGKQAQKTISTVGATKAGAAQGYANAGVTLFSGAASALGQFFGPSSNAGPSQYTSSSGGGFSDSAATAQWNAASTDTFDVLAEQDAAAGVEGPF
jgi:hypothetical protein